jgi:hypothetical protein
LCSGHHDGPKRANAKTHDPELPFPPRPGPRRFTPETIAKAAVARRPLAPSGRVIVALKLFLPREIAEAIQEQALRENKNLAVLVES